MGVGGLRGLGVYGGWVFRGFRGLGFRNWIGGIVFFILRAARAACGF